MNLDKRIESIDNIFNPFSSVKLVEAFIGADGYFANNIETFSDLSTCRHGTLKCAVELKDNPCKYVLKETGVVYKYFLPSTAVNDEESKFRPFTLQEFLNIFPLGTPITFKRKDEAYHWMFIFIGHRGESNGSMDVCIGCEWYSLKELAEEYEYRSSSGEWVAFGVKEL